VLLAGEESELTFIDHSCAEMTVSLVAHVEVEAIICYSPSVHAIRPRILLMLTSVK